MPYYRWLSASVEFVHQVTDPYLNFFRRFLPPIGGGGMGIDISPIIGIILLLLAQTVVVSLIAG
jgi:YggT family protein